jgi:hypothetical protein
MMVVAAVRHPVVWFVTRVVHKKLLVKEKEIIKKHIKKHTCGPRNGHRPCPSLRPFFSFIVDKFVVVVQNSNLYFC